MRHIHPVILQLLLVIGLSPDYALEVSRRCNIYKLTFYLLTYLFTSTRAKYRHCTVLYRITFAKVEDTDAQPPVRDSPTSSSSNDSTSEFHLNSDFSLDESKFNNNFQRSFNPKLTENDKRSLRRQNTYFIY